MNEPKRNEVMNEIIDLDNVTWRAPYHRNLTAKEMDDRISAYISYCSKANIRIEKKPFSVVTIPIDFEKKPNP